MVIYLYRRNNTDISKQILEKCKKVLLNGLLDKNDELRQQLFRLLNYQLKLYIETYFYIYFLFVLKVLG